MALALKRRLFNWPLAAKLILVLLAATLLPQLIGSTLISTTQKRAALAQYGDKTLIPEAQKTSAQVAQFLASEVFAFEALSLNNQIGESLKSKIAAYEGSNLEISREIQRLDKLYIAREDENNFIAETLSTNADINEITPLLARFEGLFIENSDLLVSDRYGAIAAFTDVLPAYFHANEEWWQGAYNNGKGALYISEPKFNESSNGFDLFIAIPIKDKSTSEILGIMRTSVELKTLSNIIGNFQIGETGHANFTDRFGNHLLDSPEAMQSFPSRVTASIQSGNFGYVVTDDQTAQKSGFAHARLSLNDLNGNRILEGHDALNTVLENLNWFVVISQPASEIAAAEQDVLSTILGLVALAAILGSILGFFLIRFFLRQIGKMQPVFQAIEAENFDVRAEVITGDELGQVATNVNQMLDRTTALIQTSAERDQLQMAIIKLLDEVADAADGDLTVEAEVTADATGAIADSFNYMIGQLREIVSRVQNTTQAVNSLADNIQVNSETLASTSEVQASKVLATSTSISDISHTMQTVSETAVRSAEVGERARAHAQSGNRVVQSTIQGMERIRGQVQETSKRIKRLGESSQEVGEIVQLIGDIADRTSILALNASIQAAAAGEAGRGFAVVAQEVEQLAERSAEASRQIRTLIGAIQSETNEAVAAMEATTQEVVEGSQLANEAGQALQEIETVSNQLAELIGQISSTSEIQAADTKRLASSIENISSVFQKNAVGTRKTAKSINGLTALADELSTSVKVFRLPKIGGQAA